MELASLHLLVHQMVMYHHYLSLVYGLCVQSEFCHFLKKFFSFPLEKGV